MDNKPEDGCPIHTKGKIFVWLSRQQHVYNNSRVLEVDYNVLSVYLDYSVVFDDVEKFIVIVFLIMVKEVDINIITEFFTS